MAFQFGQLLILNLLFGCRLDAPKCQIESERDIGTKWTKIKALEHFSSLNRIDGGEEKKAKQKRKYGFVYNK